MTLMHDDPFYTTEPSAEELDDLQVLIDSGQFYDDYGDYGDDREYSFPEDYEYDGYEYDDIY